ncbi:hypothetical protein [Streptomyces sp. NPDC002763]|uniref:hypothetical protein n=1 Tax=Streptomyces sp. NPDC002763 TaxID=3154427 RepID=UPI00331744D7
MSPVPPPRRTDAGVRQRLAVLVSAVAADESVTGHPPHGLPHDPVSGAGDEDLDAVLDDLGSLAVVRLLVLVEEEFGISLDSRHVVRDNFRSVSTLSALVESHVVGASRHPE